MKIKRLKRNIYLPGGYLNPSALSKPFDLSTNIGDVLGTKLSGTIGNTGVSALSTLGTGASVIGAAGSIVNAGLSNSKIADTTDVENSINTRKNMISDYSSNEELINNWSNWTPTKDDYTWRDVRGLSGGEQALNTLSSTGSGALAGLQVGGPVGALVGGIVGLGSSLAGIFTGNAKAKREAKRLNNLAEEANTRNIFSFENNASNIDNQNDYIALANYTAYGGPINMSSRKPMSPFGNRFDDGGGIHIKPENRDKFTALKKRTGKSATWFKEHGTPAQKKMAVFALNAKKWKHDNGGELHNNTLFDNGLTFINNGGTHEENPYEGVQVGVDNQGIPNLVEEGEVIWNDYVFSNRLKPTKQMKKQNKYKGKTFAEVAKYLQKESEERPNDPISKRGLEDSMNKLIYNQETIRNTKDKTNKDNNKFFDGSWLRYAPVVGSAIGAGYNLLKSPDYSGVDTVLEAANTLTGYTPIKVSPIGNYLTYKPFDRNYYTNKLDANAAANRRAIMNTTNPSRNAALLASDYNYINSLGELYRQGEEYNLAQRQTVENFNRGTNMANAEMQLKADLANRESDLKSRSLRMSSILQAMNMKDNIDSRKGAGISANLTNLFDSLGNIGKEEVIKDMIKNDRSLLYDWLGTYKGKTNSKGGYLTIKNRRK